MSEAAFMDAIRQGDRGQAAMLLQQHPEFAEARTEHGVSALLFALYHQQREMASLIAAGRGPLDISRLVRLEIWSGYVLC
jgi:hypothetical protein